MIKQTDNNQEWFQVTVVFGNFLDRKDAMAVLRSVKDREDYVSATVKGSWH